MEMEVRVAVDYVSKAAMKRTVFYEAGGMGVCFRVSDAFNPDGVGDFINLRMVRESLVSDSGLAPIHATCAPWRARSIESR
jgi:hypothetical protein